MLGSEIYVKFFASAKDLVAGQATLCIPWTAGMDMANLVLILDQQYPGFAKQATRLLMARNRVYAQSTTKLQVGDEIAFFPPVSGG